MNRSPFLREGLLQERLNERTRCLICERRCALRDGHVGWCKTRRNEGGTIYTLIYGDVSSLSCNPIEKKPLFHFYPGSLALTCGSWSCNFACPWCQNWDISKAEPKGSRYMSPLEFVDQAMRRGCQGTSVSFNEPTLSFEWSLEVFRLAKERDLYNTYVTNGYMTEEALNLLIEAGLDGMNVDLKGSKEVVRRYCKADVEVVWRNCRLAKDKGVHLEVTTLVIPGVNDDEEGLRAIAARIRDQLGEKTPWHLSGYFPAYRFHQSPTPLATLERGWEIGKEEGLRFVYLGNVRGHRYENTYCPHCGELLIQRHGLWVAAYRIQNGGCPECGRAIPIVGGFTTKRATLS